MPAGDREQLIREAPPGYRGTLRGFFRAIELQEDSQAKHR